MKVKIAVGVAVLLIAGGVAYAATRKKKLVCKPGSHFVPTTDTSGWSDAVAQQIRTYGGYCAKTGTVEVVDENGSGDYVEPPEPGFFDLFHLFDDLGETNRDDAEDAVLITHPWQLLT